MGVKNAKDHSDKENDFVTKTSAQVTNIMYSIILITVKNSCSWFAWCDVASIQWTRSKDKIKAEAH